MTRKQSESVKPEAEQAVENLIPASGDQGAEDGRPVRLDRRFTATEAAEQDARNRKRLLENRKRRFVR